MTQLVEFEWHNIYFDSGTISEALYAHQVSMRLPQLQNLRPQHLQPHDIVLFDNLISLELGLPVENVEAHLLELLTLCRDRNKLPNLKRIKQHDYGEKCTPI
jgi:hypothetical protein